MKKINIMVIYMPTKPLMCIYKLQKCILLHIWACEYTNTIDELTESNVGIALDEILDNF